MMMMMTSYTIAYIHSSLNLQLKLHGTSIIFNYFISILVGLEWVKWEWSNDNACGMQDNVTQGIIYPVLHSQDAIKTM